MKPRSIADICKELGVNPMPPRPDEILGLARVARTAFHIWGDRTRPENGMCGWLIGSGENTGALDFFETTHVAHLAETCPLALPFLDLPPGYRFITDKDGYVDVWFDEELLRY